MKIKLLNLNMRLGGKYTWDNILDLIRTEQPDILMLQEVRNSSLEDAPPCLSTYASLRKELPYTYSDYETQFIITDEDGDTAPEGVAIFSKFPLSRVAVLWLQGDSAITVNANDRDSIPTWPRNLLHCQATINGTIYNLMTLQGVWAPDGTETDNQKNMGICIANYIDGMENVILSGDFNVNENTETINLMEKTLNNIFKGERTSSFNMTRKFKPGYAEAVVDFIMVSPTITVMGHSTPEADVSDHLSQIAVFDL